MKSIRFVSSVLAVSLAVGMPAVVVAHVGHGDEFQAEGGINRVKVNAETDALLGIEVNEITPAADGNAGVYIPMTAIVEDSDRQLVFVHYEEFYEPVPVTLGATQGELVEITEGLSVGEQLVTQGSLSLYAESRKTQTAAEDGTEDTPTAETPEPSETPEESVAAAPEAPTTDPQGVEETEAAPVETNRGFPFVKTAIGAAIAVALGAFGIRAYTTNRSQK